MTNRYLTEPCVCGKQTMAWCMANTCNKAEQSADPMQRKLTYFEDKARQQCWCTTCRPITLTDMRFVVCPDCGNKRCPKANDHQNACTNNNEIGQKGSRWEHVKPVVAEQPAHSEAYWQHEINNAYVEGYTKGRASCLHDEKMKAKQPAQPQQEPVAWYYRFKNKSGWTAWMTTPVGSEKPVNVAFEDMECRPLVFGDTSPPASNQCKFPLCQNEDYQQALAEQIKQELYTGEPAQRKPLTPERYAQWIRNNYQDYWNIATLCDEMTKAAHGIKENT